MGLKHVPFIKYDQSDRRMLFSLFFFWSLGSKDGILLLHRNDRESFLMGLADLAHATGPARSPAQ
jgi:hypothetical protein